jgi:hypothetical protein
LPHIWPRLDPADQPAYGTNVVPLQMTRETLTRGFAQLMTSLYEPQAFFKRLDNLYITGRLEVDCTWRRYTTGRPWLRRTHALKLWMLSFAMLALMRARSRQVVAQNLSSPMLADLEGPA